MFFLRKHILFVVVFTCSLVGCGGEDSPQAPVVAPQPTATPPSASAPRKPEEILFSQPGELGIFDPSAESATDGVVYISYSSATRASPAGISTRLASSHDGGATWSDSGQVLFPVSTMVLDPPHNFGTWIYEVSSLVRDVGAPANEGWKVFAHRYMVIGETQNFALAWVAMKTAASPLGPWSQERKLFVGSAYVASLDVIIGPPELNLPTIFGGVLSDCVAFTEPGAYSQGESLFLALNCMTAQATNDRMILLKKSYPAGSWSYQGVVLNSAQDATALGMKGLMAADIFSSQGNIYLSVSPADQQDAYHGCLVYRFTDLDKGVLEREASGKLRVFARVEKVATANLSGACSYDSALTKSGMLYFDRMDASPGQPLTHLMKSFLRF